jgi:hypothetical protein
MQTTCQNIVPGPLLSWEGFLQRGEAKCGLARRLHSIARFMTKMRDNGLSLCLFGCFLLMWAAQSRTGYLVDSKFRRDHNRPALSYVQYLGSGHFWQATGENWESEFLQMGAYVFLGSFLFQRGSAESKDPDKKDEGEENVDDHKDDPEAPPALRKGPLARWLYSYSLSIAFLLLAGVSFFIHLLGGYAQHREEAAAHGEKPDSLSEFLGGAEFWFQSMQNWQSEFLAVFSIVVLTIWLRHHGSPESKKVWDSHLTTGKS